MSASDRFAILFVCTGNICRSPMAQAMLLHRLRDRLGRERAGEIFDITSAGTGALAGHPLEDDAMTVMTELGITADPFAARDIEAAFVSDADLVLTATRAHRSAAVQLVPKAVRRTFTLREFARFVAAVKPDEVAGLAALVETAIAQRGYLRPDAPEDDDVADPYRRPIDAFRAAAAQIDAATRTVAEALANVVETA